MDFLLGAGWISSVIFVAPSYILRSVCPYTCSVPPSVYRYTTTCSVTTEILPYELKIWLLPGLFDRAYGLAREFFPNG